MTAEQQVHDHERCIEAALDSAAQVCASEGARLTELRRQVLEHVWQGHSAVKAYDILRELGADVPTAKPPTVYRALQFLQEHGLVHRLESLNAFVGCVQPERSHQGVFLICTGCGLVNELQMPALHGTLDEAAAGAGFALQQRTVECLGLCSTCHGAGEVGS